MKRIVIILALFCAAYPSVAQKTDTTKKTVVVTSAFKPSVKPAAKINFSAATPVIDSTKLNLEYNVPAQNLFFTYQPVSLKPLAVSIDTAIVWRNDNFVKAGFGNYRTPFLQAGLSFGDGETSVINVHTRHISSKGSLPFQKYSKSMAEAIGIFNTDGIHEWRGTVGFDNNIQYRYGFRPDSLQFKKNDLLQRFTTLRGNIGVRNKAFNPYGFYYNPSFSLNLFSDNRRAREMNAVLDAPLVKTLGKVFALNLGLTADLTTLKTEKGETIKNNLYYLSPRFSIKSPNMTLNLGFTPAWDNQVFSLLPNFTVDAKLQDEQFVLQAGWIGYFNKNTYQSLSNFNPWIQQPTALLNTRIKEQFVGLKGSVSDHFTYNARLSVLKYSNAVLFKNDTLLGNTFVPVIESNMRAIRIHPEIGYTFQEKLSLIAGANFMTFSGLKDNDKPWGLLPMELNGSLRWQLMKDLHLKADAFFFGKSPYEYKEDRGRTKTAVDVNAGVEFTVMPKLNLWVQFNNLFNSKYQRWNQYQVLGFNVLGGVVYSFSQNK